MWVSRKPTFLYRNKGSNVSLLYQRKTSFLLAYIKILWHFYLEILVLCLFRDQRFVLFSLSVALPRSSLITGTCSAHTSYIIRRNELAEVRKRCLYHFKYGYFSYKNASICYRRHLFSPRSHVMHVLIWMDALYFTFFGCLNKSTRPCHYKGWKNQSNVLYNYDWIRLKEESHLHLGCLEGE